MAEPLTDADVESQPKPRFGNRLIKFLGFVGLGAAIGLGWGFFEYGDERALTRMLATTVSFSVVGLLLLLGKSSCWT
jgi:hypothetical protein